MIEAGVESDLVRELGDELKLVMLREHINREDLLRLRFARILMSRLRVARPLTERLRIPTTPRIISFIGPTGVGKTTTIAKIAAELVINQKTPRPSVSRFRNRCWCEPITSSSDPAAGPGPAV
jgi:flagellar biosynthesis protein FlhF